MLKAVQEQVNVSLLNINSFLPLLVIYELIREKNSTEFGVTSFMVVISLTTWLVEKINRKIYK